MSGGLRGSGAPGVRALHPRSQSLKINSPLCAPTEKTNSKGGGKTKSRCPTWSVQEGGGGGGVGIKSPPEGRSVRPRTAARGGAAACRATWADPPEVLGWRKRGHYGGALCPSSVTCSYTSPLRASRKGILHK
ncbi:hypothetical protein FKM82_024302 [Ascaphus truei]